MECYEGATMIKTFRGLLANGAEDTIVLHTNDGATGYRITKFQVMGHDFLYNNQESCVKVTKIPISTIDAKIDLSDNTLLAVGVWSSHSNSSSYPDDMTIIFDQEVFNQDIYISHFETDSQKCNYYIELEQVKLDLSESTVATLKDIRNEHRIPPG